jgi:hypothetical protein
LLNSGPAPQNTRFIDAGADVAVKPIRAAMSGAGSCFFHREPAPNRGKRSLLRARRRLKLVKNSLVKIVPVAPTVDKTLSISVSPCAITTRGEI